MMRDDITVDAAATAAAGRGRIPFVLRSLSATCPSPCTILDIGVHQNKHIVCRFSIFSPAACHLLPHLFPRIFCLLPRHEKLQTAEKMGTGNYTLHRWGRITIQERGVWKGRNAKTFILRANGIRRREDVRHPTLISALVFCLPG